MTRRDKGTGLETWRQPPANQAPSRAVAGRSASGAGGGRGGDKVEAEWRHQTLSLLLSTPRTPCTDPPGSGFAPYSLEPESCCAKGSPARAPTRPGPPNVASRLMACERLPANGVGAVVLRHPAFDRPAVVNVRGPGRKAGTVSLSMERRRRLANASQATRERLRQTSPHEVTAERALAQSAAGELGCINEAAATAGDLVAKACASARPAIQEAALIAAALSVLEGRLRRPGEAMSSPQHVRQFLALHMAQREREAFGVLFLTAQNALIEFAVMFEGTLTQTAVYPREVVKRAMALNAGAVILTHNHPSGEPEPSRADELLTQTLRHALSLVDVQVIDHVIVGRLRAVSMAERGML